MFGIGMIFAVLRDLFPCNRLAVQAVSSPSNVSSNETLFLSAVCLSIVAST